jgi:hypothetical protein
MPTSNTANTWRTTSASGRRSGEKRLLPGVVGRMGISFSGSADRWPSVVFVKSLPSLDRPQSFLPLWAPMISVIPLPKPFLIQ